MTEPFVMFQAQTLCLTHVLCGGFGFVLRMLGVVTAMETFCGQAHGAKRYQMVGVVLQRALVLTLLFCLGAVSLWLKGTDMLLWMGTCVGSVGRGSEWHCALLKWTTKKPSKLRGLMV